MVRSIFLFRCIVTAALLSATSAALAVQQFTVSGDISYLQNCKPGVTIQNGTFQAIVSYDSSVPDSTFANSYGTTTVWYQSVTSISYKFDDGSGNLICSGSVFSSGNDSTLFAFSDTSAQDTSTMQTVQWMLFVGSATGVDQSNVSFSDSSKTLFNSSSQYPDPQQMTGHEGTFSFSNSGSGISGTGRITGVTVTAVDSDGDGIPDSQDSCPHSNLAPTVTVNGVDSGVKNTLEPDGCTLMDILGDATSPNQVAHVTNQMRNEGLISGKSKGMIEDAAGRGN